MAKKGEDLPEGVGVLNFERGRAAGILERPWETDTSVYQNSWGYINDVKYYTADYLIDELIDIVAAHGLSAVDVMEAAESDRLRQIVLSREAQARDSGLVGVPGYLVNRRLLVVGAQSTDVMISAFDRAMFGAEADSLVSPTLH